MRKQPIFRALCFCISPCALLLCSAAANCQAATPGKALETSHETRFQLDFHVPDAALNKLLPVGFTSNVAAQGPAKNANLRVIFIDRITEKGADGKRAGTGSSQLVELVAPVKDADGIEAQLVIGGLVDTAANAPGAFGNYRLADTHTMHLATSNETGPLVETQDWVFRAASGEAIEMHIRFEHGFGFRIGPGEVRYYSSQNPGFYQVSNQDQQLDILRNVTTAPVDRVKEFSFKAGGGSFAKLFDGTEKVLSWDDILWFERSVSAKPE